MGMKRSDISGELQTLAKKLDSTVLQPLEEMEQDLKKAWDDAATDVFLRRLALHREIIESVRMKLDRIGDGISTENDRK